MVHPISEYASTVWDPHTNINITKLEPVQRHASRFCLGDYSLISQILISFVIILIPVHFNHTDFCTVIVNHLWQPRFLQPFIDTLTCVHF